MTTNLSSIKVPVFKGKNFEHWRIQMKNIFSYQDVWDIVSTGYAEPAAGVELTAAEQTTLTENRKKNSKATYILHQGIHESIMDKVVYIKEVKKAWDSLTNYYKHFFSKTLSLVNKMKDNGDIIEDTAIIEKILRSLPEKFESKVTTIEECNTISDLSIDDVLGSLQAYEQRILEKSVVKPVEEALQSQINWNNEANSRRYQGRKFVDRFKVRCFNCQQIGHFKVNVLNHRKIVPIKTIIVELTTTKL
ncbi:uncharacterized protein LOC113337959 [Papaver somniferum]|uniref:uncharacterized protein LOC113337959 n=1 Tax=Papaver somniferum TaxID=3469 RepID=UPI000E6FD881|nr:uncharacterized protein LOC113337959 [Papaver somniferum]